MTYVSLYYHSDGSTSFDQINDDIGENIDKVIEVALRMRAARDTVRREFGGSVNCVVGSQNRIGGYTVILENQDREMLENAIKRYLSEAGLPVMVNNGSDYDVCQRVLGEYGKIVKRRFVGSALGKQVEDAR